MELPNLWWRRLGFFFQRWTSKRVSKSPYVERRYGFEIKLWGLRWFKIELLTINSEGEF